MSHNLPALCGRYIRELAASGEALNPSLRAPIILIVGRDGGCAPSQGVLHFGSTSLLRQKARDGGVPAEEDVSAASRRIISVYDKPQLLQTRLLENWFHMWKVLRAFYCLPV